MGMSAEKVRCGEQTGHMPVMATGVVHVLVDVRIVVSGTEAAMRPYPREEECRAICLCVGWLPLPLEAPQEA